MTEHREVFTPTTAQDVTDEILEMAWEIVEGFHQGERIAWYEVWDRMDGAELADGRELSMGDSLASPAIDKIKRTIRQWRLTL